MACDESDPECGVLGYCNAENRCGLPFPVCPPPAECDEDGDCPTIQSCMICPDGSASCPEARCVAGKCTTVFPECRAECQSAEDCPQLGMPCQECPDGSIVCPGFDCIDGECIAKYAGCGYEPCAGKLCGAACTVCDPADPDCVETAVLKYCDAAGVCRPTNPECPAPAG